MNNKLLERLFNKNLYDSLLNKLNSLTTDKKAPNNIRQELSYDINKTNLQMPDVTATIAAYYMYSLNKSELSFLTEYYHKTFSAYFNIDIIKKYYNDIVKDEFLFNLICNICSKEILYTLRSYTKGLDVKKVKDDNRIVTLKNGVLKKFNSNVNIINMVNPIIIDTIRASMGDKVVTAPKEAIVKMIQNVNSINQSFKSVYLLKNIETKKSISDGTKKLIEISINNLDEKSIIAKAGTKIKTIIPDKLQIKAA